MSYNHILISISYKYIYKHALTHSDKYILVIRYKHVIMSMSYKHISVNMSL